MERRSVPILRFLRVPGVFTALADIMAGYFIVRLGGAGAEQLASLKFLLGASACLYLAGMAWNDIFDVEEDANLRPERPLPSGQLSMTSAFFLAACLTVAGLLLAMTAGMASFLVAAALTLMIVFYDALAKHVPALGPLTMGGCRGLNLLLGMTAHPQILVLVGTMWIVLAPAALLWAYTAIITVLASMESPALPKPTLPSDPALDVPTEIDSTDEDEDSKSEQDLARRIARDQKRVQREAEILIRQNYVSTNPTPSVQRERQQINPVVLAVGIATLLLVPLASAWVLPRHIVSLSVFALLFLWLLVQAYPVLRRPGGARIHRLVGAALMGICLLDAGFVASLSTTPQGEETLAGVTLVAVLLIPTYVFRRRIAIT